MTPTPPTTATLLTPPGKGGIAVIGLAGPRTAQVLEAVFRPLPSHAHAAEGALQLGRLMDGQDVVDEAIVCRQRESAEINIHGGPHVARKALELLAAAGAAVTASPRQAAYLPLAHPKWDNPAIGGELLEALAQARSDLVVSALSAQWSAGISELARRGGADPAELRQAAAGMRIMQRLLTPPEVVLAGPPNAGKSTLANALIGRQVSVVYATPGTTRDWVRELAILSGVPVWLTDTAGIWDPPGAVDAEAVRRARQCVQRADLILLLSCPDAHAVQDDWIDPGKVLRVWTKADLMGSGEAPPSGQTQRSLGSLRGEHADRDALLDGPVPPNPAAARTTTDCLDVSAATGQGMDEMKRQVLCRLGMEGLDPHRPRAFTARQAGLLTAAADALAAGDDAAARKALNNMLRGE